MNSTAQKSDKVFQWACGILILILSSYAHAQIALPTATPVDVHSQANGTGYGTFETRVNLKLTDEPEGTAGLLNEVEIGKVDFKVNGLIYTKAKRVGNRFEKSYTAGYLTGVLKDKQFTSDGNVYDNTFEKTGYFLGYRPAYSGDIYHSKSLDLKYAYTMNYMLYYLEGDYTVNANMADGSSGQYGYDEVNFGLAFKPTAVIQPTWNITSRFALTVYGGVAAFAAIDNVNFIAKSINNFEEEDDELAVHIKPVKLIYGYDISFVGLFSDDDVIKLSSTLSFEKSGTEDLSEVVVIYTIPFL